MTCVTQFRRHANLLRIVLRQKAGSRGQAGVNDKYDERTRWLFEENYSRISMLLSQNGDTGATAANRASGNLVTQPGSAPRVKKLPLARLIRSIKKPFASLCARLYRAVVSGGAGGIAATRRHRRLRRCPARTGSEVLNRIPPEIKNMGPQGPHFLFLAAERVLCGRCSGYAASPFARACTSEVVSR